MINISKIILILILIFAFFCLGWVLYLRRAHSTFENYYKFRGCAELISKTDETGLCKLKDDKTIKLVKYRGKWFLDGDLPNGKFLDF